MRIDHISIYPVLLPFSSEFSHSLRKRYSVKNIIVQVVAEQSEINGYGEGAPRSFVRKVQLEVYTVLLSWIISHGS